MQEIKIFLMRSLCEKYRSATVQVNFIKNKKIKVLFEILLNV